MKRFAIARLLTGLTLLAGLIFPVAKTITATDPAPYALRSNLGLRDFPDSKLRGNPVEVRTRLCYSFAERNCSCRRTTCWAGLLVITMRPLRFGLIDKYDQIEFSPSVG